MIEIDGSAGEGGGQILRTSLSLSAILRKPFRIYNIRKNRKKPGLMPQHLMAVRAMKAISAAEVSGDSQGSLELVFKPGAIRPGHYSFDIGTAGSTSLLLQTLLPPLLFAEGESFLSLKGGTHVPFSPPFHYISEVFIPMLNRLGVTLTAGIEQYGFYPRGGGKISARVIPQRHLRGLQVQERGTVQEISGISGVGNLPLSIAERQAQAAQEFLRSHGLSSAIDTFPVKAEGQGTFIFLKMVTGHCVAGFSSLGERGKPAEQVGEEAARQLLEHYRSSQCLDHNLADQIVLYLTFAKEHSVFTTSRISAHLIANLEVIRRFFDVSLTLEGAAGSPGVVTIGPLS